VEQGYTQWSRTYDGPNPAIAREEPVVRELLTRIPAGDALDAACGTGRHALLLSQLGHRVIGVDATEAMLKLAREKVPGADFRQGRLEALPVEAASIDVLTCALAVEHCGDLGLVFDEFARVLRSGGYAIVSDMHPVFKMTGGVAAFPTEDGSRGIPFVTGFTHQIGDYARAFVASGFALRGCVEAIVDEETLSLFPSYQVYPDATRQAFLGLPFVVIWHLQR
jgi:ubiquinone/menaquinone biosynthesis C-methylase UbiE